MRPTREMRPRPFVKLGLGQAITSVATASNTLALGNVVVQNAAGSNYHFVSTSSNTGIWVPHESDGAEAPIEHGNLGTTETINVGEGTWHRGTLNANVAITVTGFTSGVGQVALVGLAQDGTGGWDVTWDADVDFGSADDQPDQTASSITWFVLWTDDGNADIFGAKVGGGGSSSLTVQEEGVSLSTAATTLNFVGAGVTASGTTATKTITIPGRGGVLLESGHAVPFTFDEILQESDGSDFLYASE